MTASHNGRRRVIVATDKVAASLGLRPGLPIVHALAMVPGLNVAEAELQRDAQALHRLALWCQRYTPLAAPCPPDGLWLDIGGGAHLFGGEPALLKDILQRLDRNGVHASAALADTHGAAHALARHRPGTITLPGQHVAAMAALRVSCLRLPPELEATLDRLGFDTVARLASLPRPSLNRRFGLLPGLRLDQAHGKAKEELVPLPPEHTLQQREVFPEPLLNTESLGVAIVRLVVPLCAELERSSLGARRLDLVFERLDHHHVTLSVSTISATRHPGHLAQLLMERLDTVDPRSGVEAMHLIAPLAEPLHWEQKEAGTGPQDLARLVDRLSNRLGPQKVYRATPIETSLPEQLVRLDAVTKPTLTSAPGLLAPTPPQAEPDKPPTPALRLVASTAGPLSAPRAPSVATGRRPDLRLVPFRPEPLPDTVEAEPRVVTPWKRFAAKPPPVPDDAICTWPGHLKHPVRLFTPPRPVLAMSSLPDHTPIAFTWRRRHKVTRAEGPQRVHGTWWTTGSIETSLVRDYFQVEVENGQRFWLFRRGDGPDSRPGNLTWFLHGLF